MNTDDWWFVFRRVHTLIGHRGEISNAQFNFDSSFIVTGSMVGCGVVVVVANVCFYNYTITTWMNDGKRKCDRMAREFNHISRNQYKYKWLYWFSNKQVFRISLQTIEITIRDKKLIFVHLYSANSTIRFSNARNKEILKLYI